MLHLCLEACAASLHWGGGGGLTWTVTPGEPSHLAQQCLSITTAAVCLSGPRVLSLRPTPDRGPLRGWPASRGEGHTTPLRNSRQSSDAEPAMTTSTECRLCRYAGGVCTTGYRKSHVRSDPACRLYKAIDKGTENVVAMSGRQKEPSQSSWGATPTSGTPKRGKAAPAKPNLDHMITFRTGKKRLGLLFHPSPLDKWIGRKIQYEETTGKFRDEAGEYLNDEMAESYSNYWGRLRSRHELGKAADKLVCITDKYLPRITDETRAFIMRFPHRIPQLLKQARQVRSLARGGKTMPKSQTGRTLQSTTTSHR